MHKIILLCLLVFQGVSAVPEETSFLEPNDSTCEGTGWVAFQDEKCFKLIPKYASRTDAEHLCAEEKSSLLIIKSKLELDYLIDFLFNKSAIQVSVWLGAKRNANDQFRWDDEELIEFANWGAGYPTQDVVRECVEMQSKYSRKGENIEEGKWRDVSCQLGNYVVCQKAPRWSLSKLQNAIIQTRSELVNTNEKLAKSEAELTRTKQELVETKAELSLTKEKLVAAENRLDNFENWVEKAGAWFNAFDHRIGANLDRIKQSEYQLLLAERNLVNLKNQLQNTGNNIQNTQNQLDQVKQNPVPIGFIYVQLPHQPEPSHLWPQVSWEQVTGQYSGHFFRAEGDGSAPFGELQGDNAPRLAEVQSIYLHFNDIATNLILHPGQWTATIQTGAGSIDWKDGLKFRMSDGEVRPKNMAIRIWKRVK